MLGRVARKALLDAVDEAAPVGVDAFDAAFVAGDGAALDAEDVEEVVVEALRLALFVMGGLPVLAEGAGAALYLIPTEPHASPFAVSMLAGIGRDEKGLCL